MERRAVSGIMLTLVLISMLTLAFNIQPVKSDWTWTETIYIRADGSVYPDTAPISSIDNITYTFKDNIVGDVPEESCAIVIERKNIVVDGAGYTLQGTRTPQSKGIRFWSRNVTIRSITIKAFAMGILFCDAYNTISGTHIANNGIGICILIPVITNYIFGNNITNNGIGVHVWGAFNTIIYHNNFIDNTVQAHVESPESCPNVWDDGYPSGGNYWTDYEERYPNAEELNGSGIWDTPYIIDENNEDNYPLMNPWTPIPPAITATIDIDPDTLNLRSVGKWITAYIQLPEEHNAENIDITTILLNETISPVLDPKYEFVTNSSEYLVDHDEDGILERMAKFDKAAVMALLTVGEATLTITGKVNDTSFEGSDTIRVR